MEIADLSKIAQNWGLTLAKTRPMMQIAGSPERTAFRIVMEDDNKRLFVLEEIPPKLQPHKLTIAKTLDFLSQQDLTAVHPYLKSSQKEHLVRFKNSFWQIVPYVPGALLKRPDYISDRWRGRVSAEFLIELREKSRDIPYWNHTQPFSIKDYIYDFFGRLKKYNPDCIEKLLPVLDFLEEVFLNAHDSLPVCFCHGDFHPMNVIWSDNNIKSVIDWEFMGFKPEVYDIANLIGCLGMEHPRGLTGEFACTLIKEIQKADLIKEESWNFLIEFIIAIRFGWFSEWLRRSDTEMIELEEVYMKLLIEKRDFLKKIWDM